MVEGILIPSTLLRQLGTVLQCSLISSLTKSGAGKPKRWWKASSKEVDRLCRLKVCFS